MCAQPTQPTTTPHSQITHRPTLSPFPPQLKKGELLDQVVKKAGVTKVMADKVLTALTDSIAESLADGKKSE